MDTRRWLRSFRYAYEGIQYALSGQRNLKFHFFVSILVLLLALIFRVSKVEILFLLLSITLMFVTEMLNTAIEKAVDLAMPDLHPIAKIAKDVAAGAVLVAAVFAVAVGMIIFYDPIDRWIHHWNKQDSILSAPFIWTVAALVFIVLIVIRSRLSMKRSPFVRPSIISAAACAVLTLIFLLTDSTSVLLLAAGLVLLIGVLLYEKTDRSLMSLVAGGGIGSFVTLLCYYLYSL